MTSDLHPCSSRIGTLCSKSPARARVSAQGLSGQQLVHTEPCVGSPGLTGISPAYVR